MSTSAESAANWLREAQPDQATIKEMMEKLARRIEESGLDEEKLQGSIEAMDVLEAALNGQPEATDQSSETPDPQIDTSPLFDHGHTAPERPRDEKLAMFEELKAKLNNKV